MIESKISLEKAKRSAMVLANVAELTTGIIREISGNDIANSLNGSKLTNGVIQSLVIQKVKSLLDLRLPK